MNETITALAFCFNEEKRIGSFLDALCGFAPVTVVDNHSTDRTVAIARSRARKVITHRNAGYAEHPDTVRYILNETDTPWIYWGRVDEIPPAPLLLRLDEICRSDAADVVFVARRNMLFGRAVRSWGDDYQMLFFKGTALEARDSALFEMTALKPGARVLRLPAEPALSLWHFSAYDIAAYTATNNRYSSLAAKEIIRRRATEANYSVSRERSKRWVKAGVGWIQSCGPLWVARVLAMPVLRFLWHYGFRGGFRSGREGFVTSYLMMMEQMLIELKVAEADAGVTLEGIERDYDRLKAALIAGEVPTS